MTLEKPRTETPSADERPSPEETAEKKGSSLSIPGLLAGAATAATMSVLGGHLSVVGTVLGAALTSIVSGLAVVVYSTSIEKSRRGLKKVRTVVAQRVVSREGLDAPETHGSSAVADDAPMRRSRLPLRPFLVSTGVIIGLAVAAVFGIQALTGTELSSGTGQIQRTVTGEDSVAVRSAGITPPGVEPAPGTAGAASTEGNDPAQEAPADAPTSVDGAPSEVVPTGGAVTGDGTGTSGDALPDTGSQQLGSGRTGADNGVPGSGAVAPEGAAGAGAVPAAP